MAFENRIIASMGNLNAAEAWREARFQHHWKIFHAERAAELEDHNGVLRADILHQRRLTDVVQKELQASREENRAVHAELGEMHDAHESALTLASTYCEAYFEQQVRANHAEKLAFQGALSIFTIVALQAIAIWGVTLLWLP